MDYFERSVIMAEVIHAAFSDKSSCSESADGYSFQPIFECRKTSKEKRKTSMDGSASSTIVAKMSRVL